MRYIGYVWYMPASHIHMYVYIRIRMLIHMCVVYVYYTDTYKLVAAVRIYCRL